MDKHESREVSKSKVTEVTLLLVSVFPAGGLGSRGLRPLKDHSKDSEIQQTDG